MSVAARWPLRVTVPLFLLAVAAVLLAATTYLEMDRAEREVEADGTSYVVHNMTLLQGVFEQLLRRGEVEGVQSGIADLASNPNTQIAILLDDKDRVLHANETMWAGLPGKDAVPELDAELIGHTRETRRGTVLLAAGRDDVSGYYPLVISANLTGLKPAQLGVFYLRYDLSHSKAARRYQIQRQLLATGLYFVVAFLALGIALHFVVTRRVSRLVSAVRRFSAGDFSARADLQGTDDLARIGDAFNGLVERVAGDQRALRQSEEHFRHLVERSPVATAISEGNLIEFVNERFTRTFGYTQGDVPDLDAWWQRACPDAAVRLEATAVWREAVDAAGRGHADIEPHEYRVTCKDGTVRSVEIFGAEIGGKTLALFNDITDRKRAEEEREVLQGQLVQAQKMEAVGRLAGGVAHDFNNMLSVIIGHADLAMDEVDASAQVHGDLAEIRRAAQRSTDLTQQLLAFARRQTIAPRILDVNETVADSLKMLGRLIGEDIDLGWLPGADVWPVTIDPAQVDQILTNLCVNARAAISGVGTLTIETGNVTFDDAYCADHAGFVPGPFVGLTVSDNGSGMPKDVLEHIFEPFFTTKGLGQGTGLGLATVYGIVKQNDGFVNVYSEPGAGTTFKIYLPASGGESR